MIVFTIPLGILAAGYLLALFFAYTGRRFARRFFFPPLLMSLLITVYFSFQYENQKLELLPGQIDPTRHANRVLFLPLYALRIAPLSLGVCLIVNAAGYYAMTAVHRRRAHKDEPPPAAIEG